MTKDYIEEQITVTFRDSPIYLVQDYWNIGGPFVVYDIETNEPFPMFWGDHGYLSPDEEAAKSCFKCNYDHAVVYARNRALDGYGCYLLDHGDERPGQCEFYEPVGTKFEITTDLNDAPYDAVDWEAPIHKDKS